MKHVKLFETFLNEEASIEVTTTKTIKLKKGIEEQIKMAAAMKKELAALIKEHEEKIRPIVLTLEKNEEEILDTLKKMNISQVKVDKTIAKVMFKKGRLSDSYSKLWEEALKKVNENTQKVLLELQASRKKTNPDHWSLEYETSEGLKDVMNKGAEYLTKAKEWFKTTWKKMKASFNEYFDAVDDFEKVGEKIAASAE